jgi:putative ABC transport system substrate-binding protein
VTTRRGFVSGLALAALSAPRRARAQQAAKVYRIAFLALTTAEPIAPQLSALKDGLRALGYVEGRNIAFESRYADGRLERLPGLAAELVGLRVDVIVAGANPSIAAAKRATETIPIVMGNAVDPVAAGFIASLARPGGNITGLSFDASQDTLGKHLATLKEIVPKLSRVGVLRQVESGTNFAALETAARQLNVTLEVVDVRSPDGFEGAVATMIGKRIGAFIVIGGPLTYMRRQQIADLALKNRLPGIHSLREYAQAGLLISYGPNLPDLYRRAATYVDKILKGAKPGDLPVEQPTKFELVVNLKTAKALGLTIPQSLLARADEVIQ